MHYYHSPPKPLFSVFLVEYTVQYIAGKLYSRKCCQLGIFLPIYISFVGSSRTRANLTCINVPPCIAQSVFDGNFENNLDVLSEIFISKKITDGICKIVSKRFNY